MFESGALAWLVEEVRAQPVKFTSADDDAHTRDGLGDDSWWWQQLTNYYGRARVLGLETPLGRQALAKFVATAVALLDSVIRCHGPLPTPGHPSGEIEWPPE
jgi:hypothetical protein